MSGGDAPHIRLRQDRCPYCGKTVDSLGTLQGEPPLASEGDMSVCFGCGEVMQFDADFRLQKMSAAEIAALTPEEAADLKKTQEMIRAHLRGELNDDPRAACMFCGAAQPYGRIRCDRCGAPLVFPRR
jgi:hypothetical protein